MRVLVSTKVREDKFPRYLVTKSIGNALKEIKSHKSSVEVFIINTFNEPSEVAARMLSSQFSVDSVPIIYIASQEDMSSQLRVVVTGLGGSYHQDDFYLGSQADLDSMMSLGKELELSSKAVSSSQILKGIFSDLDGLPSSRKELAVRAADNLVKEVDRYRRELIESSRAAVGVISSAESSNAQMARKIGEISKSISLEKASKTSAPISHVSSTFWFPEVPYNKTKPIYRIKEVGHMKYLTSFVMGFQQYLRAKKHNRPRLIVAVPPGEVTEGIYSQFPWINSDPSNNSKKSEPIIFTHTPKGKVLSPLFDDTTFDTVVFLDRLTGSSRHIIRCNRGRVVYACEGATGARFISHAIGGNLGIISSVYTDSRLLLSVPTFTTYPSQKDQRENLYTTKLSSEYERLIRYVGIKG